MVNKKVINSELGEFSLRPLKSSDANALSAYFLQMSDQTKQYFGPHPLSASYAQKLCLPGQIASNSDIRLVLVQNEEPCKIYGYFIVQMVISENELSRFAGYNLSLKVGSSVSYAPSMAESLIGEGIGSQVFLHIKQQLILMGISDIVLMGGVQKPNTLAVHYYQKFGFRHVGGYQTQVENLDMLLRLEPE